MSRTHHHGNYGDKGERRIRIRGVRKEHPDLRKIARAIIEYAQMQAEAEAQAQAAVTDKQRHSKPASNRCRTHKPSAATNKEDGV